MIGIIGAGQMGGALIKGFIHSSKFSAKDILVKGGKSNTAKKLQEELQFNLTDTLNDFEDCQMIILATNNASILSVLTDLGDRIKEKQIPILSVAAGVSLKDMQEIMGEMYPLAHCIPNTPVQVNEGILAITYAETIESEKKQTMQAILSVLGRIVEVPEIQLDIFGTIAGCGPAFVDVFIEALSDAAVLNGMPRAISYEIAAQMMKGTAELALKTNQHPGELKDSVTSPGGTTIKGIVALEKNGFRHAVIDGINEIMK